MCIARCGESMSKVMSYLNAQGNKQVVSTDGVQHGVGPFPEETDRQNAAPTGDNLTLGELGPDALPFSNLDLLFENSADKFWSGLDFAPLYEEVDTGQVYL